jgi:hypothetical protein
MSKLLIQGRLMQDFVGPLSAKYHAINPPLAEQENVKYSPVFLKQLLISRTDNQDPVFASTSVDCFKI